MGSGFDFIGGDGIIWMLVFAALLVVPFWRALPRYGIPAPVALIRCIGRRCSGGGSNPALDWPAQRRHWRGMTERG